MQRIHPPNAGRLNLADGAREQACEQASASQQDARRLNGSQGPRERRNVEIASGVATREDELIGLLSRHRSQLFGFIFCMVQSLPDAEDVFQQTAVTMWDKFDQFQRGTDFLAWASSIARYKSLSLLKSKRRERTCFSDDLLGELAEHDLGTPEFQQARLHALAACREKLSKTDQHLLALCYGDGGTIRDVAGRIGRPVGSVYDSLSRIRKALHGCIQRTLASEGYA